MSNYWQGCIALGVASSILAMPASYGFLIQNLVPLRTFERYQDEFSFYLPMGLYDEPLPPRPPPRIKQQSPSIDDDDWDDEELILGVDTESAPSWALSSSERLFEFTANGKELLDLLPNLGRRLDSGVACYFEPTDRKAVNLIEKTGAHPDDVCWALEACKGDVTEAWTRISTARRLKLNQGRHNESEGSLDFMELEAEEEFQERKEERARARKLRDRDVFLQGGVRDERWLPTKNPNPVEDEPWFTG